MEAQKLVIRAGRLQALIKFMECKAHQLELMTSLAKKTSRPIEQLNVAMLLEQVLAANSADELHDLLFEAEAMGEEGA